MTIDIYLNSGYESYSTRETHQADTRIVEDSFILNESTRIVRFSTVDGNIVTIPLESVDQIIQKEKETNGNN